ncbi:ABC transporter permease [Streptomyces qinzhouensis]|uniref:ABC transporter permease n=1 Tax=Streptomyces qinzhouensis TaxID=2599401 RepID=UPI001FE52E0A|nr:ABC transporter permease [Streptomyces qinzhouensis]
MTTAITGSGPAAVETAAAARGRRRIRLSYAGYTAAAVLLVLLGLAAAWPGLFATHAPDAVDPIGALRGPSGAHLLGTDELGRDVFSRLVHGTRLSLLLGLGATALAVVAGTLLGVLAATSHRAVDETIMRVNDVLLAFPGLLLALLVVATLGPGTRNATIAIGLSMTPGFIRLARAQALTVKNADYVTASLGLGLRPSVVYRRHLLPNAMPPLLVFATLNVGTAILAGSALSFLGLGPQPPTPEWGAMLADGRNYLDAAWTAAVCPGLLITLTVASIHALGAAARAGVEGTGPRGTH